MTDKQRLAVLRWLEVQCKRCKGRGQFLVYADRAIPVDCPDCDGTGYHLSGATRENWLWWDPCYKLGCRAPGSAAYCTHSSPRMPDFPNDPAASLVLAEHADADIQIRRSADEGRMYWAQVVIPCGAGEVPERSAYGPTLGAALLAAPEGEVE